MRLAAAAAPDARPGRTCPVEYRYSPRVFDREPELVAETLYVVGGLYGNVEALAAVMDLAAREPGPVALVFNGDFHWFDTDPGDFARVNAAVLGHAAMRGNVETEVAGEDTGAGCGCAYPADVSDAEVWRSNGILAQLRVTAARLPGARASLARLPMHLVASVGDARIGVVHGDATSLAGWGFARDRLDDLARLRWVEAMFGEARVDVFASSHTCLPAMRRYGAGVVANNGAAGMPNFEATRFGLATRIGVRRFAGPGSLYGTALRGVHVEAIAIAYDHARWMGRFVDRWPAGSAAHASYFRRMEQGARGAVEDARPR